jgi:DHA1 family arabinose polymer transporter-like MFS transporter
MLKKIHPGLLSLAIGGFGIGLTEFVIMGLLPDVATALSISIPEAGRLIAAYAFGVVVGAPILVLLARALPPKKILIWLMVLFTIFNGLSALAPGYYSLLILRFLSGLPHGAFFGVGAVLAARIAGPGKAASAFAIMLGGLTICNVIGVPIATYVGHEISWRASFGLVSIVGLLTIVTMAAWIPHFPSESKGKATDELVIFKNKSLWYGIGIASIGFGGFFSWFSYITPLLLTATKFSPDAIPYLLSLAGLGMTFGNWLGGKLSDRLSPTTAVTSLMLSMAIVLIMNSIFAPFAWGMIPLMFITGANAMAMGAPIQMLLIDSSKESPLLGSSIGQAAFNLGNSLGAFLGGIPIAQGLGPTSALWIGSLLALFGMLINLKLARRQGLYGTS